MQSHLEPIAGGETVYTHRENQSQINPRSRSRFGRGFGIRGFEMTRGETSTRALHSAKKNPRAPNGNTRGVYTRPTQPTVVTTRAYYSYTSPATCTTWHTNVLRAAYQSQPPHSAPSLRAPHIYATVPVHPGPLGWGYI
eukprot:5664926-Pyramimonas_sp.AAC.1